MVAEDRAWVSFLWSYPNLVPLDADTVADIARRVARFRFGTLYGGWWGHVVADARGGRAALGAPLRRTAAGLRALTRVVGREGRDRGVVEQGLDDGVHRGAPSRPAAHDDGDVAVHAGW